MDSDKQPQTYIRPTRQQPKWDYRIVQCTTDLEHLYRIYSIPTHDKHQWLLLQFIVPLMMDAKGVRNMQNLLVVVNKHNTVRDASCWFIIYYRHTNKIRSIICIFFKIFLVYFCGFITQYKDPFNIYPLFQSHVFDVVSFF